MRIDIYDLKIRSLSGGPINSIQADSTVTGFKFRNYGEWGNVVVYCTNGAQSYAAIVDYDSGEEKWRTTDVAYNPHSVELLPNGIIAVASSEGNEIRLFNINDGDTFSDANIQLTDAHGTLWDPEWNLLWTLGKTDLKAYEISLGNGGTVSVEEKISKPLITSKGHDLAPVYDNDKNKLWVTTDSAVYVYNKDSGEFTLAEGSIQKTLVKGIGNFKDGSIVMTYPDGKGSNTNRTKTVSFYLNYEENLYSYNFVSENNEFYKIRVYCTDYQ